MVSLSDKDNESSMTVKFFELLMNMPVHEQDAVMKELEEKLFKKDKRRHLRKPYFMVVDYASQNRGYQGFIKNISTGGVFIATPTPIPIGQKVSMTFQLPVCKKHVRITGEIVRINGSGIGVKFKLMEQLGMRLNLYCLRNVHGDFQKESTEVIEVAKVRKKRVRWSSSTAPDVGGYKLYWAVNEGVNYDSDFFEVGNVTEVILPDDVPSFPLVAGDVEVGITAINRAGNESDMAAASAKFDFTVPAPPTDIVVEDI